MLNMSSEKKPIGSRQYLTWFGGYLNKEEERTLYLDVRRYSEEYSLSTSNIPNILQAQQ